MACIKTFSMSYGDYLQTWVLVQGLELDMMSKSESTMDTDELA